MSTVSTVSRESAVYSAVLLPSLMVFLSIIHKRSILNILGLEFHKWIKFIALNEFHFFLQNALKISTRKNPVIPLVYRVRNFPRALLAVIAQIIVCVYLEYLGKLRIPCMVYANSLKTRRKLAWVCVYRTFHNWSN